MRIVIDLQGAQSSNSRNRGIGRYTLSLILAIIANSQKHDIVLALNGAFQESIGPIRDAVSAVDASVEIAVWYPPADVEYQQTARMNIRKSAEFVREAFLISLQPSVILVTSLFEGCDDDAVTSLARIPTNIPVAVILYDLIPLINNKLYLNNEGTFSNWYFEKVRHLKRAQCLLAISSSSRQEAIDHLGFNEHNAISISTAADAHFVPTQLSADDQAALRHRYGLSKPFVMYTGGIERRKNIDKLITAYARLPLELRLQHQLAIVCSVSPFDRDRLRTLALANGLKPDDLILTGYVPEQDLVALYGLCKLFVFPSWHEGFGLPALEAMNCGAAVISANTSSLPEVVGLEEAMFDPHNEADITSKIKQGLTDEAFVERLKANAQVRAELFSWDACAKLAVEALEHLTSTPSAIAVKKPRLAYVSPLPPERSGIGDYSAELLPYLSNYYDIDLILNQDSISSFQLKSNFEVRTAEWLLANRDQFDRVLYHFGNSHFHEHMHYLIRNVPGVIVLHDFFLSNFLHHHHMSNPGLKTIQRAVYTSHGYAALENCTRNHWPHDIVSGYPCSFEPVSHSVGVIVHSQYSVTLARQWYDLPEGAWDVIPLLRTPAQTDVEANQQTRAKLGLAHDDFVVCSFGFAAPTKLSIELYEAWVASALARDPKCVLVFVGDRVKTEYGQVLQQLIDNHGLASRVKITGWAEEQLFRDYLVVADVGVQLRTLSRGETSAAVLDCMNYGVATIVNANGSMAELPDSTVYKLEDEFDQNALVEALTRLRDEPELRETLGRAARHQVLTEHAPDKCAQEYFLSIERSYAFDESFPSNLTKLISNELDLSDAECLITAATIDKSIAPRYRMKQLLVDVTELVHSDLTETADRAQREVVKSLLLQTNDSAVRVEPIYFSDSAGAFKYAHAFTLELLDIDDRLMSDQNIHYQKGDVYLWTGGESKHGNHELACMELKQAGIDIKVFSEISNSSI